MTELTNPHAITLGAAVEAVYDELDEADLAFGHGAEDAEEEAYWLVLSACKEPLGQQDYDWGRQIKAKERTAIRTLLDARISTKKPLAYLLNQAWFAGIEFYIDERALVPRSFMAEWLPDQFAPWVEPSKVGRILDLCCGSGCIGITAALAFDETEVVLSDLSADALAVAKKNVERYALQSRAAINHGAMFDGLDGRFDLILCNPPYVSTERMQRLPAEYRAEPEMALAAGEDGLDFLRPFLASVREYLNDGGILVVEAGSAGPVLEQALPQVPFTWLGTEHDEMVLFLLDAETLDQSAQFFTV